MAIVEVTLIDGTKLTERVGGVRGTPENPMTRDEVVAKADTRSRRSDHHEPHRRVLSRDCMSLAFLQQANSAKKLLDIGIARGI